MSIESISPKIDPQIVKAPDGAHRPDQQKQERSPAPMDKSDASQSLSEERKQEAVDGFYSAGSMNTEAFVVLRSQGASDTLEVLDEVISEMAEKTSKDTIGLQVLEKTLDAIDKYSNNE